MSLTTPLRTGPPTRDELRLYYPPKFTWNELKTFINAGDLGLLKRDKKLQKRYEEWLDVLREKHGSIVNYLQNVRLQWGKPDTQTLLGSSLDDSWVAQDCDDACDRILESGSKLPPIPADVPPYFTADTPRELISIIQNDWPYSVPSDVEHTLIWTRLPIFHPALVADAISARIDQDGIWGFTGNETPPPSPSLLPACLPALSEWGVTMDGLVRSGKATDEERGLIRYAGKEVDGFVRDRWKAEDWETAWFVNPPRLQSIPGLAHIHVFARRKH